MKNHFDYLIIGAGPAGLQLGYFLQRNGRDYVILERAARAGAFFAQFPRHRKLISINKVHTGKEGEARLRYDWNSLLSDREELRFPHYSERYFPDAGDLTRYMDDFARAFDLNIRYSTTATRISRDDGRYVVSTADGQSFTCNKLVIASGFTRPNIPDFPGAGLCETYWTHDTDPSLYVNQRVLIVGKGNSAFETAENLIETAALIHLVSPHSVVMAWQTHYVGNLRAVNNDFLDTYQLKSQNAVLDASILSVERRSAAPSSGQGDQLAVIMAYSHAHGQTTLRCYDRVILCTGFRFDDSIFDESCRPETVYDGKFPAQNSEWESVNLPNLYFAGTLMHACDYRKTMSGFIHGFRHNIATLANHFEEKYHGRPWPRQQLPATPDAIMDRVTQRLNNSPGLFLQPGFLQDAIVVSDPPKGADATGTAEYFEEMRHDYIHDRAFRRQDHYYTVSLEYGHFASDPFNIERDPDPMKGDQAPYLHPVIRRYHRGEVVSEHHIQDDLENEWDRPEYVEPARAYFEAELTGNRESRVVARMIEMESTSHDGSLSASEKMK